MVGHTLESIICQWKNVKKADDVIQQKEQELATLKNARDKLVPFLNVNHSHYYAIVKNTLLDKKGVAEFFGNIEKMLQCSMTEDEIRALASTRGVTAATQLTFTYDDPDEYD